MAESWPSVGLVLVSCWPRSGSGSLLQKKVSSVHVALAVQRRKCVAACAPKVHAVAPLGAPCRGAVCVCARLYSPVQHRAQATARARFHSAVRGVTPVHCSRSFRERGLRRILGMQAECCADRAKSGQHRPVHAEFSRIWAECGRIRADVGQNWHRIEHMLVRNRLVQNRLKSARIWPTPSQS